MLLSGSGRATFSRLPIYLDAPLVQSWTPESGQHPLFYCSTSPLLSQILDPPREPPVCVQPA